MLIHIPILILLVIMSGTFAGLTLALFSIKLSTLEAKIRLGDARAQRVYNLRKKGNILLCTLLLGNVSSYTILTLYLENLTTNLIAGFVATSLIFLFGEILPQAVFPRHALFIGAKLDGLIWAALVLFYPISAPIAWLLDQLLGKETPVLWSKEELGEIIKYHEEVGDGIIDEDEERIILGALSFSELKVADIMIPEEDVFCLEKQCLLDEQTLAGIRINSFSKIPVYDTTRDRMVGLLFAKDLIGILPDDQSIQDLYTTDVPKVKDNFQLDQLLNLFLQSGMHMAIVEDEGGVFLGVVTMEDIMEEVLRIEIDEKN